MLKKLGRGESPRQEVVEEIEEVRADREFYPIERDKPISYDRVLSTGSTRLDLAISGERIRGGGIPGGVFVEVFGPESTGKTAIIAEVMSSAQKRKPAGKVRLCDPEGRFSQEHARIFDMEFPEDNYFRPDTVVEMFDLFADFAPMEFDAKSNRIKDMPRIAEGISVFGADSLAAFSTKMEMESEDKMGMKRASDFSKGLRKYARRIHKEDVIFLCSNQIRETETGTTTPGGRAIRFYADIRIELKRAYPSWRIDRNIKLSSGKEIKQQVGIISAARVVKNSCGPPFREADVYIEFGYGVDDIRDMLQWYKDVRRDTKYGLEGATAQGMDRAVWVMEGKPDENGAATEEPFVGELREKVIDLWEEIQDEFQIARARKVR